MYALSFRSTCTYCHATHIEVGPTRLKCCPASATAMETLCEKKKLVSGKVLCAQGVVVVHGEVGGGTHRRAKTQPCVATRVRVDSNYLCTHSLRSTLKGERKAPPTNHHLWRRPRNPNGAWLALHFKLDSADPFMQDGWPSSCDNGSPKWNLETSGGLPTLRCRPTGGERGGGRREWGGWRDAH